MGLVKFTDFYVLPLDLNRQISEELSLDVKDSRTLLMRTEDLLKIIHFMDGICVQARFTKIIFVLTVGQIDVFFLFFGLLE